ncbi:MAG: crotonase/enoyl-CoA hydratase family protein [Pseudomonadota bacterium]
MTGTVRVEHDRRGIATLWLARPEKHNALDAPMIDALASAAARLGGDRAVRAVVLRAEGKTFCAGGDLAWMRAQLSADRASRLHEARRLAEMLLALDAMPKPLLGAVTGNAFGGGVGLIAVTDVAVSVDTAQFGLTETRLGLIPATIGPYVAARLGPAARRVFMAGRMFGATEAVALGLLALALPTDALEDAVSAEAEAYLATAPGAVGSAKTLLRRQLNAPGAAEIEASIAALADQWETEEAAQGITAFFDKRPPPWV